MDQLGRVAMASGAGILLVFALSCWLFDGQPFKSPAALGSVPGGGAPFGTATAASPLR